MVLSEERMNAEQDEIDLQIREQRATAQKHTMRFALIIMIVYAALSLSHWLFSVPSNGTVLSLTGTLGGIWLLGILDRYVNTFIMEFRLRSKGIDQKLKALEVRLQRLSKKLPSTARELSSERDQDAEEDEDDDGEEHESNEAVVARYRAAAERGEAWAQYNFGVTYSNGDRLPKDKVQAAYWFKKAAEQGDTPSRLFLADILSGGQGVEPDYAEAVRLYRLVADDAHVYSPIAEHNLGEMYANGKGVLRDDQEAIRYWERAAKHGWSLSAGELGRLYERGAEGIPRDYAQAYFWYLVSIRIDKGKNVAEYRISERDSAASHLDSATLHRVLERVERWSEEDANLAPALAVDVGGEEPSGA
jgi:TPR repeat protein